MRYCNIPYEGLDETGKARVRFANVIDELPTPEMRAEACADAAPVIGRKLGLTATGRLLFGAPVYLAFGLTRPQAAKHESAELLLKLGCDVSLTFCGE